MLKRYGNCCGLCFFFLLVGIVIGGCVIAAAPRPDHIHMTVLPWGKVNVSPKPGDIIDWVPFHSDQTLSIAFENGQSPCKEANGSNSCTIRPDIGNNIFPYICAGQAACPDPGSGPSCKTCGGPGSQFIWPTWLQWLEKIARQVVIVANNIFLRIDRAFGFVSEEVPPSVRPATPEQVAAASQLAMATQSPASPQATPSSGMKPQTGPPLGNNPAQVLCVNNVMTIKPMNITQPVGQYIYWSSPNGPFTLKIDPSICSGDTSQADTEQECKVAGATKGTAYSATFTDGSCKNMTITTPTIISQ